MKNKKNIIKLLLLLALILLIIAISMILLLKKQKEEQQNYNNVNKQELNVGEFVQIVEDGIKLNISTELNKTKYIDSLEISNIRLINQGDQSILTADIKNTGNTITELTAIRITILDKDKNTIGTLEGLIDHIEPNATTQLNVATQDDIANAYDFEITKK